MKCFALLALAAFISVPSQLAVAGDKHWKHHDHDRDDDDRRHRRYADRCFREEHLRVIHDYYRERGLPPGLAKKYYRTGELPPGWARRVQPLPYEVEERLPPVPPGCARGYVDGYAVMYQPRTHLVIDFHAVF